jgi:hypothetical protein
MAPSPPCSLVELAHLIDHALGDDAGDLAFALVDHPTELVLEVLPLRDHPCVALAGLVGPPDWRAFGVRVQGRAHLLDQPHDGPLPVVTTFVADRAGRSASLLRRGGSVAEELDLAQGRIPDLCRRILTADGCTNGS